MSKVSMSVTQAAEFLGVHPQRVHQRIRDGSLPAEKVGHQWVIDVRELHGIGSHSRPGRPLSAKSAWDLIAVAASEQAASQLSPSARSRARARLRNLVAVVASAEPDVGAAHLMRALRNRTERALFVASGRDLPDVRDDERVHLSGISLPESRMSAGDVVEGYAVARDVNALVEDYLLSPASRSRANVILHVVQSGVEHPALSALDDITGSSLMLAADLAEHVGVREHSEAIHLLAGLRARSVVDREQAPGDDRG